MVPPDAGGRTRDQAHARMGVCCSPHLHRSSCACSTAASVIRGIVRPHLRSPPPGPPLLRLISIEVHARVRRPRQLNPDAGEFRGIVRLISALRRRSSASPPHLHRSSCARSTAATVKSRRRRDPRHRPPHLRLRATASPLLRLIFIEVQACASTDAGVIRAPLQPKSSYVRT